MSAADAPAGLRIELADATAFDFPLDEDSLLRAALRAGVPWPYECSVGGCGSCRFDLLEGEVEDLWPGAPGLGQRERARGRRLACQSRPLTPLRIKARLDEADPALRPARRMSVRLLQRRALGADMAEFTFESSGPAQFLAGQYALFHWPGVPGPRAYSMSNLPNPSGLWSFIVRRAPHGAGSRALFEGLLAGTQCDMDGPYGHAYYRQEAARDIVCVAGGSGLGPMLSIVRAFVARPAGRRLHIYYGVRDQRDLASADDLRALADARLADLTVVLSQPAASPAWSGATGFVHEQVERDLGGQARGMEHYLAGPPPMLDAMQDYLLLRAGVPHRQIHFDRFV